MESRQGSQLFATGLYVALVVVFGTVLHPELKAFYHQGHGNMKNTVSAIDTLAAFAFLAVLRGIVALATRQARGVVEQPAAVPFIVKLRWAALPGSFVFLVITLSTWANFLSYEIYAVLGPSELLFVWAFARCLHAEEKALPVIADLPCVLMTALGSLLFALSRLRVGGVGPVDGVALQAVLASLLCRACQALMTVSLRSCCMALQQGTSCSALAAPTAKVTILEIAQWKLFVTSLLCVPYALITEGTTPWRSLISPSFWADSASAWLLVGSVFITSAFQFTTVGANAGLRSPLVAVLVSTLTPLSSLALVLIFADSPWCKTLGLQSFDQSPLALAGIVCLVLGLLLSGAARCSGSYMQRTDASNLATTELLNRGTPESGRRL
eukprot:TRINITY_DN81846_c0_g1_i1.p1 TRINITY_DN81846_c0_g1~~TRINITY_DN81846_c0_g1_i1.p1  ORF type:complete len:383 (+),score=62.84 TRINITY_DN81846_c0_g1_i1:24-1172(+)